MSEKEIKKYLSAMRVIDYNKDGFVYGRETITGALDLIEKKDKIINEMADYIDFDKIGLNCFSLCVGEECQKECIKQYFERKVKE